jgi:hypothetical protein
MAVEIDNRLYERDLERRGGQRAANKYFVKRKPTTATGHHPGPMELGAAQRGPPRDMKKITCYGCGKTGHYKRDCRSKGQWKKNPRQAGATGRKEEPQNTRQFAVMGKGKKEASTTIKGETDKPSFEKYWRLLFNAQKRGRPLTSTEYEELHAMVAANGGNDTALKGLERFKKDLEKGEWRRALTVYVDGSKADASDSSDADDNGGASTSDPKEPQPKVRWADMVVPDLSQLTEAAREARLRFWEEKEEYIANRNRQRIKGKNLQEADYWNDQRGIAEEMTYQALLWKIHTQGNETLKLIAQRTVAGEHRFKTLWEEAHDRYSDRYDEELLPDETDKAPTQQNSQKGKDSPTVEETRAYHEHLQTDYESQDRTQDSSGDDVPDAYDTQIDPARGALDWMDDAWEPVPEDPEEEISDLDITRQLAVITRSDDATNEDEYYDAVEEERENAQPTIEKVEEKCGLRITEYSTWMSQGGIPLEGAAPEPFERRSDESELLDKQHPQHAILWWPSCYHDDCETHRKGKEDNECLPRRYKDRKVWGLRRNLSEHWEFTTFYNNGLILIEPKPEYPYECIRGPLRHCSEPRCRKHAWEKIRRWHQGAATRQAIERTHTRERQWGVRLGNLEREYQNLSSDYMRETFEAAALMAQWAAMTAQQQAENGQPPRYEAPAEGNSDN